MWCIGALSEEYRKRMYELLQLYARPYRAHEPVICIDEKSKQLIRDSRPSLAIKPGVPAKCDYEYVRAGTCNVFVAVEPKGGRRVAEVTERRTKPEFVGFVQRLLEGTYASARIVHLVLDNLNTHFRRCFEQELGRPAARALLRRVRFHYTPKHGRDRDQHHGGSMPGSTSARPGERPSRGQGLGAPPQCRTPRHRLDLHAPRCG